VRRYHATLGRSVATRLLLGAEEIDAAEMLRVGFLHRLVPREELAAATDQLVDRLVGLAPLAVQAMKQMLLGLGTPGGDDAARELIERCERSEDFVEGVAAMREGRKPRFLGR
jgi:enoyl-CoA hydratase/carnithine racemase